jgi:hypothetical protein
MEGLDLVIHGCILAFSGVLLYFSWRLSPQSSSWRMLLKDVVSAGKTSGSFLHSASQEFSQKDAKALSSASGSGSKLAYAMAETAEQAWASWGTLDQQARSLVAAVEPVAIVLGTAKTNQILLQSMKESLAIILLFLSLMGLGLFFSGIFFRLVVSVAVLGNYGWFIYSFFFGTVPAIASIYQSSVLQLVQSALSGFGISTGTELGRRGVRILTQPSVLRNVLLWLNLLTIDFFIPYAYPPFNLGHSLAPWKELFSESVVAFYLAGALGGCAIFALALYLQDYLFENLKRKN